MRVGTRFLVKAMPVLNRVTGGNVKNDSCMLCISDIRSGIEYTNLDIELSCLPSLSLSAAYGIVYLTNFKVGTANRTNLEVYTIQQVAYDAIIRFYHPSVSILTTPTWFDALDHKVGLSSLSAFAERFKLSLNTKIGTMVREGNT